MYRETCFLDNGSSVSVRNRPIVFCTTSIVGRDSGSLSQQMSIMDDKNLITLSVSAYGFTAGGNMGLTPLIMAFSSTCCGFWLPDWSMLSISITASQGGDRIHTSIKTMAKLYVSAALSTSGDGASGSPGSELLFCLNRVMTSGAA